jgi:hypothetical protein
MDNAIMKQECVNVFLVIMGKFVKMNTVVIIVEGKQEDIVELVIMIGIVNVLLII